MPQLTNEQEQVVFHDSGNILVSASAGSGKTHTMIERVKRLVLQKNVNVNEILCVTFTEKAAAEMREKLKKALSENVNKENERHIKNQLVLLPTADISTMHSFCGRLIRTYFFKVGVSPDFAVMDETNSVAMKYECVEQAFKEFYDLEDEWFLKLVDRHGGRTDAKLVELVISAYDFCNSEARPDEIMEKYRFNYSPEGFKLLLDKYKGYLDGELIKIREEVIGALEVFNNYNLPKAISFAESIIADIDFVVSNEDVYVVKAFEDYSIRLDFERKIDETVLEYKQIVADCRDRLKKLYKRFAKHLSTREKDVEKLGEWYEHTSHFIDVIKRFSQIYYNAKRDENVVDFNDLEHFALEILSDGEIRQTVKNKYKYVFVDEYQDTNGVQEEIINAVSNDNLFMVGDDKQSIYGFRGCRPEYIINKLSTMQQNGQKVVMLNHNFRSSAAVIDTVNRIFSFCMTKEYYGENYKGRSELIAGDKWQTENVGRSEVHLLLKPESEDKAERPRIYDVLSEANDVSDDAPPISSLVAKIIDEELYTHKTYYDPKERKYKNLTYGDIVILTRNKNGTYVKNLVKGLIKHNIPVVSDVKESVCSFPEIITVINALKVVDCFKQDMPLASTLKSPIGKFTDEDLVEIVSFFQTENPKVKEWGFSDAYRYYLDNADTALNLKLKEFDAYMERLRALSDFIGAEGVMNKLVKDCDLESYFLSERQGKSKVGRLRRFMRASVMLDKKLTVKELLYKVETAPDSFGFSDGGEENAVRVMTIHASKGLEFPVVIACGLERAFNNSEESEDVLFSRKYGFAVKSYDDDARTKDETFLRGIVREDMKRERTAEEMRLLYVATTRAQYSLHLTFEASDDLRRTHFNGASRFLDYVPSDMELTEHTVDEFDFITLKKGVRKVIISEPDEKIKNDMQKDFAYSYPFAPDTVLPLKIGVTAAVKNLEEENSPTFVLFDEPSPDIEKGNIAHKILEYFNFDRIDDFSGQIKELIKDGIVCESDVLKVNLERIERAVKSGAFDGFNRMKLYREKSFIAAVPASIILDSDSGEDIVVQGIIDLLAVDGDSARIVDYKYSALSGKSLLDRYKKQLDIYAFVAQKLLGKKISGKTLVNLFTGDVIDFN